MSEKRNIYPQMPSAPTGLPNYEFANHLQRGPPPSYEESQKNPYRPPQQPQISNYNNNSNFPGNNFSYNQNFQAPAQHFGAVYQPIPQYSGVPQTVEFEAGARFKGKGGGSVRIPPPPPGCMPTPAQLAALQGQPVILKKKKNSFF